MKYRTPLARVRGLGSAKDGTHHWWAQRITAVALVPLSLWFMGSLISMASADYTTVIAWLGSPVITVLWIAFIVALFYHAQLGVQVVVEDYVGSEWLKITTIVATKLLSILLGVVCALAVLRIALGD
jgi:succinate dehydrogenase / fumarate reductase membrane anchor subunit